MSSQKVLIIPMAGHGRRFQDAGYRLPKQFLRLGQSTCLVESLKSLDLSYFDKVIVGCRAEFDRQYNVIEFLKGHFPTVSFGLKSFEENTSGSLDTVHKILTHSDIHSTSEIAIFTLDVRFTAPKALAPMTTDAEILTVKTNNPGFSYVKLSHDSKHVAQTAEKRIISDYGAVGLYRFSDCETLIEFAGGELRDAPNYGNEYYICPMFNRMIASGKVVGVNHAVSMEMFGTPDEYEFCKSLRNINGKNIAIASDHSGFLQKEIFKKVATDLGYQVDDYGCYSSTACDYDDFVFPAALSVASMENDFSVSFCSSGQGVNISASNVPNIRSVLLYDLDKLSEHLMHNAPNHFSIPSSLDLSECDFRRMLEYIKNTEFEGGRHQDRLMKVRKRLNE